MNLRAMYGIWEAKDRPEEIDDLKKHLGKIWKLVSLDNTEQARSDLETATAEVKELIGLAGDMYPEHRRDLDAPMQSFKDQINRSNAVQAVLMGVARENGVSWNGKEHPYIEELEEAKDRPNDLVVTDPKEIRALFNVLHAMEGSFDQDRISELEEMLYDGITSGEVVLDADHVNIITDAIYMIQRHSVDFDDVSEKALSLAQTVIDRF